MSLPPIDGQTKLIGIFGDPIAHTFSPAMHNAAFKHLGLNYRYVPFHVKPKHIKEAVEAIRALDLVGVNVTVPHKEAVIEYLDELDGIAEACQAVNTVVNYKGKLIGYNTDSHGFSEALQKHGVNIHKSRFLLLGAGGAARGALSLLGTYNASKVFLYNRTLEKAHKVARRIEFIFPELHIQVLSGKEELKEAADSSDILINCTILGLKDGDQSPLSPLLIKPGHVVFDLVYHPTSTELMKQARMRGAETVDGIEMLLYQGMKGFRLWTGIIDPPLEVMQAALLDKIREICKINSSS